MGTIRFHAGKKTKNHLWRCGGGVLCIASCGTFSHAQNVQYTDYPQHAGTVATYKLAHMPEWLKFSGELRQRVEGQTSYSYADGNERVYDLSRTLGSVEIHPQRMLLLSMQVMDSRAPGITNKVAASNMRDTFDLRQGKVQFTAPWNDVPMQLTVGRNLLAFGSQRLVGTSDWTNTSRSFDGFFGTFGNRNAVHLFSTSVVTVHPTSLDTHGAGLTFHGAYGSIGTWVPAFHPAPFVFVRTRKNVVSQTKHVGNEIETTVGIEAEGSVRKGFFYMVNGALQRGSYSTDSIHSGETFTKLYYQAHHLPMQPRLGVEYDYASGNAHHVTGRASTWDQLYPSNHNVFGLVDLFGFQNIREERINLDLAPARNLILLLQTEKLSLVRRNDNLYSSSASNVISAPKGGFTSTGIGTGLDVSGKYVFRESTVFNAGAGHLFTGPVLLHSGKGAAQTLAYFSITHRFQIQHGPENHHSK